MRRRDQKAARKIIPDFNLSRMRHLNVISENGTQQNENNITSPALFSGLKPRGIGWPNDDQADGQDDVSPSRFFPNTNNTGFILPSG